ncbi:MAG: DUF790 family protein, partial [Leptolyngbya sp. SIO4C5]|nr:DUF790 family protein [Leptolyngbya sp. SIO4C5]
MAARHWRYHSVGSSRLKTALGCSLSLNQTILAGVWLSLIPALSKFSRSETAKIKSLHPDGRTYLLEIVGYWRPEYLRKKFYQVQQSGRRDLILAVS